MKTVLVSYQNKNWYSYGAGLTLRDYKWSETHKKIVEVENLTDINDLFKDQRVMDVKILEENQTLKHLTQ